MTIKADTGNGATLTLPSGVTYPLQSIASARESIPMLEASVLATTGAMDKIPGDLIDHGEWTARMVWDATKAYPAIGSLGTITVTYPIGPSQTTAATYAGTGCVTGWKQPDFSNGQVLIGELSWSWNGDTGPTYTVAS